MTEKRTTVFDGPTGPLTDEDLTFILEHTERLELMAHRDFDNMMPGGDAESAYFTIDVIRRLVENLRERRKTDDGHTQDS